jgi:3-isopropylmalate dehydrogenase
MKAAIAVLPGDGIGPEVTAQAVRVLEAVGAACDHRWTITTWPIGGAALGRGLPPLPDETLAAARQADAVLLGAVGDPAYDHEAPARRPEAALLALRRELDVFANIRPLRAWPGLDEVSPLKARVLAGTDLVIVRELTSGLYYGEPRGRAADGESAVNTMAYTRPEIARVTRVAFDLARRRRRHLTSVDKANVLDVSRLWREVVIDVARSYPDVTLAHEYVDAAAMKLALTPTAFDVLLTENLFGDILSDEAGAIAGSLGLLPSASLGFGPGLFEPVHGSAPSLAGTNAANPIGAIASVAMLLADGLGLVEEGALVVAALDRALTAGHRTADLVPAGTDRPARSAQTTTGFTDHVLAGLGRPAAAR